MATITAVKSGNWDDPTTWDLGRVPQSGDIVQCGNYVVNLNVAEIDLGNGEMVNTGSGRFEIINSISITAAAIRGDISRCLYVYNKTADVIVSASLYGGSGSNAHAVEIYCPSTVHNITINGNVCGGIGDWVRGISFNSQGLLTVNGDVFGGQGSYASGVYVYSGRAVINGTAMGADNGTGYGISCDSASAEEIIIFRVAGNNSGPMGSGGSGYWTPAVRLYGSARAVAKVYQVEFGPYGASPFLEFGYIEPDPVLNRITMRTVDFQPVTLLEATADADYPSPSDVRQGVAYDYGDLVGTCAVPSPEFVARGVPVDDTEGQAVLLPSDIWNWPLGEASEGSIGKLLETKLGMITAGQITLSSPVTSAGNIVTVRGDDYHAEDGRALVWTVGTPADITGATIRLEIPGVVDLSFAGEVVDSETIRVELDAADTEMVPAGRHAYKLVAEQPDGDRITLAIGFWTSV